MVSQKGQRQTAVVVWICVLCAASVAPLRAQPGLETRWKSWNWGGILPGQRPETNAVLAWLKDVATTNLPGLQDEAKSLLVQVGDAETADQLVKMMRDGQGGIRGTCDAANILLRSRSPRVVPLLEPVLQIGIATQDSYEAQLRYMRSMIAVGVIGYIVKTSPEFTPAVREWAKTNLGDHRSPELTLRWLAQNMPHFAKQDYAAVTPFPAVTNGVPQPVPK